VPRKLCTPNTFKAPSTGPVAAATGLDARGGNLLTLGMMLPMRSPSVGATYETAMNAPLGSMHAKHSQITGESRGSLSAAQPILKW
jgi:hypothetical protein